MQVNRLLGTALSLITVFFIYGCGGVGVSNRNSLKNPRTSNGADRTTETEERVSSAEVREADTSGRISNGGRSASSMESYFDPWLNSPYLLGGDSFNGIDCSGLVNRFYTEFYSMDDVPRTTSTQYSASVSLPQGKEQAGDMIFFKNTYRPGISHVGIYLGDGRFVHAANSGVEINDLGDSYYKTRFAGFRRFSK